jgi:hypothetical protein
MRKSTNEQLALGKFNTRIAEILDIFNLYGMGIYLPEVKEAIHNEAISLLHAVGIKLRSD